MSTTSTTLTWLALVVAAGILTTSMGCEDEPSPRRSAASVPSPTPKPVPSEVTGERLVGEWQVGLPEEIVAQVRANGKEDQLAPIADMRMSFDGDVGTVVAAGEVQSLPYKVVGGDDDQVVVDFLGPTPRRLTVTFVKDDEIRLVDTTRPGYLVGRRL